MTGRPDVDPARKPGTGKSADFCPGVARRQELAADRVQSPQTRMIYIPANNNLCASLTRRAGALRGRQRLRGRHGRSAGSIAPGRRSLRRSAGVERGHRASRSGCTPTRKARTGDRCWRPAAASCSPAARAIGKIHAFDASTGKLLWEYPTKLGHRRAADIVLHRRQTVHRRAVRLGRRRERHAGRAQPRVSRRVSAGAGRRCRVGVRARVTGSLGRTQRTKRNTCLDGIPLRMLELLIPNSQFLISRARRR